MPNRIGKISAARSVAYINTFVGEKGMLFYDITTGNIRISDGVTPGGQPLALSTVGGTFGDFYIYSNNLSTINTNEDINLISNGTGQINIAGQLHVHPTSSGLGGIEAFSVNQYGEVKIVDAYANVNTAVINLTGNADGSFVTPVNSGVMFQQTGQPGAVSRLYNDGNANYSLFVGRRYNGSSASPTQILSGQTIVRYGGNGYATGSGFAAVGQARMEITALENFTSSAQGTQINFYATQQGTTTLQNVLSLTGSQVIALGDILPSTDNTVSLGSAAKRFKNLYVGPGTLFITDQTLNTLAAVTVNNGVFNLQGIAQAQLPILLASAITGLSTSGTLALGQSGDTGVVQLYRTLTFPDATTQSTAGIPLTQKGAANGVATLGSDSKVSPSQLPAGAVFFKGTWNANSNNPTLADGTGTAGWEYQVATAGTVNLGSGSISYNIGDFVLYNGTIWQKVTGGTAVVSVNGLTGSITGVVFTSDTGTVTNTMLAGSIANNKLANSSITTTAGSGITLGGSSVALGGTLTITNAGVTSNVAGTGITVSSATGAVTITNAGVTSLSAGTAISVSGSTGSVTVTNTGVTSVVAGTYMSVNSGTGAVTISTNATALNTVSTLVARDSSGNFAAGSVTASRVLLGVRTVSGGTTCTIDFAVDSIILWTAPSGTAAITLQNYTAGAQVKLIIAMTTSRDVTYGISSAANSSDGNDNFNGSGAGSVAITNTAMHLEYTCISAVAGGCYVKVTVN